MVKAIFNIATSHHQGLVGSGFCPTSSHLVIRHSLAVSWTTVDRLAQSSWPASCICIGNQLDQGINALASALHCANVLEINWTIALASVGKMQ